MNEDYTKQGKLSTENRGFKNCHPKFGGRKRGTKNKFTVSAKKAFEEAFDELGGAEGLTKWAIDNQTDFYKLYARLIPVDVKPDEEFTSFEIIIHSPEEQLEQKKMKFLSTPVGTN